MLHQRLDINVVKTIGRGKMRVRIRSLRQEIGGGCSGILRNGGLDAFDSEPVCYRYVRNKERKLLR